jgi:hypothetical protein
VELVRMFEFSRRQYDTICDFGNNVDIQPDASSPKQDFAAPAPAG